MESAMKNDSPMEAREQEEGISNGGNIHRKRKMKTNKERKSIGPGINVDVELPKSQNERSPEKEVDVEEDIKRNKEDSKEKGHKRYKKSKGAEVCTQLADSDTQHESVHGGEEKIEHEDGKNASKGGKPFQSRTSLKMIIQIANHIKKHDNLVNDVKSIGFDAFLEIQLSKLVIECSLALIHSVDAETGKISFQDNEYSIQPRHVTELFRLPSQGKDIELSGNISSDSIITKYELGSLTRTDMLKYLTTTTESGEKFKILFALFIISFLLCPKTTLNADLSYLALLQDVNEISSYNWGTHVINVLLNGLKGGYEPGKYFTGCIFFLIVFYCSRVTTETWYGGPAALSITHAQLMKLYKGTWENTIKLRTQIEGKNKDGMENSESKLEKVLVRLSEIEAQNSQIRCEVSALREEHKVSFLELKCFIQDIVSASTAKHICATDKMPDAFVNSKVQARNDRDMDMNEDDLIQLEQDNYEMDVDQENSGSERSQKEYVAHPEGYENGDMHIDDVGIRVESLQRADKVWDENPVQHLDMDHGELGEENDRNTILNTSRDDLLQHAEGDKEESVGALLGETKLVRSSIAEYDAPSKEIDVLDSVTLRRPVMPFEDCDDLNVWRQEFPVIDFDLNDIYQYITSGKSSERNIFRGALSVPTESFTSLGLDKEINAEIIGLACLKMMALLRTKYPDNPQPIFYFDEILVSAIAKGNYNFLNGSYMRDIWVSDIKSVRLYVAPLVTPQAHSLLCVIDPSIGDRGVAYIVDPWVYSNDNLRHKTEEYVQTFFKNVNGAFNFLFGEEHKFCFSNVEIVDVDECTKQFGNSDCGMVVAAQILSLNYKRPFQVDIGDFASRGRARVRLALMLFMDPSNRNKDVILHNKKHEDSKFRVTSP